MKLVPNTKSVCPEQSQYSFCVCGKKMQPTLILYIFMIFLCSLKQKQNAL